MQLEAAECNHTSWTETLYFSFLHESPALPTPPFMGDVPPTAGDWQHAADLPPYVNPDTEQNFWWHLHIWRAANLCLELVYIVKKIFLMFTY